MGLTATLPQDELNMGLDTLKKNLLSLQNFVSKTLPTLQTTGNSAYGDLMSQASSLADKMKGTQQLLMTTLGHVQSDLDASGALSVKTGLEMDVCRNQLSQVLGNYDDFLSATKNAFQATVPGVVNTIKLGVQAVASTAVDTAAKLTQVVEQTGQNALTLSSVVPYLPYIAAGVAALYVLALLPRPRRG